MLEDNRLSDAQSVALIAVSSPLSRFHPEWVDTLSDVRTRLKRRSTISMSLPEFQQAVEKKPAVIDNPVQKARVDAVIKFMEANLHEKITLDQLCQITDLASSQLARVFKAHTGLPPIEYLVKLRMEKASHLLSTTFQSVKVVMAKVGYGNRHHFLQLFNRYFNTTPTAYRKQAMSQRRNRC